MVLEVLKQTKLIRNEVVADNLFSHIISRHVSGVHRAATSHYVPKNEIDGSQGQEDNIVCKVEDQVDVKVGRSPWH